MKTFSYTARNREGVQVRGTLEAAGEKAAFQELRRMGLLPSRIQEGTLAKEPVSARESQPSMALPIAAPTAASSGWPLRAAGAGMVVLTLAAGGWWWLAQRPPRAVGVAGARPATTVVPTTRIAPTPMPAPGTTPQQVMPAPAVQPEPVEVKPVRAPRKTITISSMPLVYDEKGNLIQPEPAFKSDTEIALSSLLSTPPGVEPIDLSPPEDEDGDASFAEDAKRAMSNIIVIQEDDDEQMAAHKEKVGWAKVELADVMKAGYTPREYTKAVFEQLKDEAKERQELVEALEKIAKEEDEATTLDVLKKVNEQLKEKSRPLIDKSEFMEENPPEQE